MPQWWRALHGRLQRAAQTRTDADTPQAVQQSRLCGTVAAYRVMASLQLTAQLLLWALLTGYDRAAQTLWQSALMLIPAAVLVWAVSRWAWSSRPGEVYANASGSRPGQPGPARSWEKLLLLPCLLLDALLVLSTLLSLLQQLMPSYPSTLLRIIVPGLLTLGLLLARDNGVAFGGSLWRWPLVVLALLLCLTVIRTQGTDRLFPLMGGGLTVTARTALTGLGAVWPATALFAVPEGLCGQTGLLSPKTGKPPKTFLYILIPLLLLVMISLTASCAAPWRPGDSLSDGARLQALNRSGGSVMASGLSAVFWLILLMLVFCGSAMNGGRLLMQVFPQWRQLPGVLLVALPVWAALWIWPESLPTIARQLLPWRLLPWALAAAWAGMRRATIRRRGGA